MPPTMQKFSQRPWLDLYRGVRPELTPASDTALAMFRATLARNADAPLVYYFDRSLSGADCDAMSDALAVGLQERGVEAGDRVAVYLQNVPQVLLAVLAIWKVGAVVVPCNPMLRERELGKILRSSGCLAMICQEDLYADVGRAALPATAVRHTITTSPLEFLDFAKPLPTVLAGMRRNRHTDTTDMLEIIARHAGERPRAVELTGDDVAFMVHTSGTTGDAKGAMNTHRNVVFATSVYEAWVGLTDKDVILGLAPLFHVTGLIGHVTLAVLTGSPLVLFYRFEANEACRLAALHRATFTVSSITAYIALLNSDVLAKYDLSSLTKLYTGGAPTPATVLEDWHGRTGVRIQPMYGLTEATSPTHMTPHGAIPPIDPHTGAMSVGVPVCNTHVRVITDAGTEAGPREIGEFVIAGPQIVPGYWQKPEETAKSLTTDGLKDRRRRLHGRAGLVLSRRSLEGHDHRVGFQGLAARSRGGALPASGRARGGRRRHPRSVSRRDDQSRHQLEAGPARHVRRDPRVRSRAHGCLQVSAGRRDHGRPAEDHERQDHAPAAATDRARECAARAGRDRGRVVSAAARRVGSALGARSGCGLAALEPRHVAARDYGGAIRSAAGHARAVARRAHIHRPRSVPRGQ